MGTGVAKAGAIGKEVRRLTTLHFKSSLTPVQAPLYRYFNLSNSPTPFSTSLMLRIAISTTTSAIVGIKQKTHLPSSSPPPSTPAPLRYSTSAVKPRTVQIAPFSHGSASLSGPFSGAASRRRCSKSVS